MSSPAPLVVHESGDLLAPPLVLLHGLTEAGTTWPDAVRRWSPDWHLLAVDLRGHGRSPRFTDDELPHVLDTWLADLHAVVCSLPSRPILVGHSLGALLAVIQASAHADTVRAVVLEDPPLLPEDMVRDPAFADEQEAFLDRFAGGPEREAARMRRESAWSPEEIDAWAGCKPLVDRRMIRAMRIGGDDWDAAFDLLAVPTLLVIPESGGTAVPVTTNPLVRVARIPGVGHCIRRDDPVAFHAVVDPFLAAGA